MAIVEEKIALDALVISYQQTQIETGALIRLNHDLETTNLVHCKSRLLRSWLEIYSDCHQ